MFTKNTRKVLPFAVMVLLAGFSAACRGGTLQEAAQETLQETEGETATRCPAVSPPAQNPSAGPIVLMNGTLVDGTGADPIPNAAIVIENGLIAAVGPAAEIPLPDDATVIDVEGQMILPGLIEARASLFLDSLVINDCQISKATLERYLNNTLEAGVTTVRDTAWDWEKHQDIAGLRAMLAAHGNTVPTVVIAGTPIGHRDGSVAHRYPRQVIGVVTVEEARQATERVIELGVDQVSLVMSIPLESDGSKDGLFPALSAEQLEMIMQVAHEHGKWVFGQAVFPDESEMLVAAGVDEISSWPSGPVPIPESLIQQLVARAIPVVSGFNIVRPQEEDVRRFLDAGGTLVFGTFAPNSGPLNSPYREFMWMERNGMTPMEIIQSATANAAHAVGLGDVVGTLEVGKRADIIVVDGNPLEDLLVMGKVAYVVKGGELVVQPEGE